MSITSNPSELKTELANALSHGIGIVLSIIFLPILLTQAVLSGNKSFMWACTLYGFAMLLMFTSSTLYHSLLEPTAKYVLRIFDHCSIFILIGGTYAPIVVRYVNASTATWFLSIQWGIIAVGIILKIFFTGRYRLLSTLVYIGIGLMVTFISGPFWSLIPTKALWWLFAGCVSYLVGTIFYQFRNIPYNHSIWHLFVLFACIAHYLCILEICLNP